MVLNAIRIFDRVQKLSCENIMLQSYHLVLQKSENLKYHLHRHSLDNCARIIGVYVNKYNFHRYLGSECVTFNIFAFLVVFSSPEPKARVSYCRPFSSVVRRPSCVVRRPSSVVRRP